jgi:hypothetical protein
VLFGRLSTDFLVRDALNYRPAESVTKLIASLNPEPIVTALMGLDPILYKAQLPGRIKAAINYRRTRFLRDVHGFVGHPTLESIFRDFRIGIAGVHGAPKESQGWLEIWPDAVPFNGCPERLPIFGEMMPDGLANPLAGLFAR